MTSYAGTRWPARSHPGTAVPTADITAERMRGIVYRLLCVFWFTVPWEGVIRLGGTSTIAKGAGVLLAAVAIVSLARSGRRHAWNDYIALVFVFAAWVACSLMWTVTQGESQGRVLTMAQLVLMVLLTWEFAHTPDRVRGLMCSWVAGCLVIAGIIVFAWASGQSENRYVAPGTHPGDQAYALLLGIPMAWYLALRTARSGRALAYRLFVPLAVLTVVLTASRAALLSVLPALAIIPMTMRWMPVRARVALSGGLLVCIVAAGELATSASGPIARLSTTSSEISSGTLDNRTTLWSIALRLIAQHPVLGLGTGGSKIAVGAYFPSERGLHDTFLSIGVELGVIGLGLFLLLGLAACVRAVTRTYPLERRLAIVLTVMFVISLVPRHDDYEKSTYAISTLLALIGSVFARTRPVP